MVETYMCEKCFKNDLLLLVGAKLLPKRENELLEKLMYYAPYNVIAYPLLLSFFIVFLNFDPFILVFSDFFPAGWMCYFILVALIRIILTSVSMYFFLRTLWLVI